MTVHILDMPEHPGQLHSWIEAQLVDVHLAEVVSELLAVHGESANTVSLDELLGVWKERILSDGLLDLTSQQCTSLLTQPRLLFELQELIVEQGSSYWKQLANHEETVSRGMQAMSLDDASVVPVIVTAEAVEEPYAASAEMPTRKRKTALGDSWGQPSLKVWDSKLLLGGGFVLMTMIITALAIIIWMKHDEIAWGWGKEDALQTDLDASSYMVALADSGNEWFDQRPSDTKALEIRLRQLRDGCDILIAAEHEPLNDEEREWLRDKCRAWRGNIEQHRTDLTAGKAIREVRDAADETVRKLVTALKSKGTELEDTQ
jgi:hypothetical protein